MVKAVFLDRDGTLNKLISGRSNPKHIGPWLFEEFEYIDGVEDAVKKIKRLGYTTHVVTNQPDVDDNLMTEQTLDLMHQTLKNDLKVDTIQAARTRNTPDYKPNNGMIEKIVKEFKVTRERSYMIGDTWKDVVAGYNSNLTTIYLGIVYECPEQYKNIQPNYICDNLLEASKIIEQNEGGR